MKFFPKLSFPKKAPITSKNTCNTVRYDFFCGDSKLPSIKTAYHIILFISPKMIMDQVALQVLLTSMNQIWKVPNFLNMDHLIKSKKSRKIKLKVKMAEGDGIDTFQNVEEVLLEIYQKID